MPIEIAIMVMGFYIFLIIATLLLSIFSKSENKKSFRQCYILLFILLVCWSILCRTYAIQQDILVYMEVMKYGVDSFFSSFYFLREPVYWVSSGVLYGFIKNEILVLVFCDIIAFTVLVLSCYHAKLKPYFVLLFFLFFPSVMGILNVYRQFLATIFLFCFFLLYKKNFRFSFNFMFILACFTHNMAGVFFPLLFLIKKRINIFLLIISSVVAIIVAVIFQDGKSTRGSGDVPSFLFLVVIFVVFFIFVLLNRFSFKEESLRFFYINLYVGMLAICSVFFLSDVAAKRILMVGMIFLLFSIYSSIEERIKEGKNRFLIRIFFVLISIAPTFLFSSVLEMLLIS
ncbi:EpsG family protein [Glaesserella parasuis]|uniref:EpsG family protein n=1 Tax=Glaesserella parasuis TaxID=738 RepID=UPI0024363DE3|nr:EpsG family protein [Glaesserella parasuis]MDG6827268.1 EpsG family protein [Glaesserella parasuis]